MNKKLTTKPDDSIDHIKIDATPSINSSNRLIIKNADIDVLTVGGIPFSPTNYTHIADHAALERQVNSNENFIDILKMEYFKKHFVDWISL